MNRHKIKILFLSLLLIIPGTIISMEMESNLTPEQKGLYRAIIFGDEQVIDKYIANKGDLNILNEKHETPLFQAIKQAKFNTALKLLNAGSNPSILDYRGMSPLTLAVFNNHIGSSDAYEKGNIALITALLDKGVDVNIADSDGDTPLHTAVAHASPAVIKLLLNRGANLMARNNATKTPLKRFEDLPYGPNKGNQDIYTLLKNALIEKQKKHAKEQQELMRQRGHQL